VIVGEIKRLELLRGSKCAQAPLMAIAARHVTAMRVIPVAGHDSMLLNLSGAHAPFFTRNSSC
jgi:hypothetical protein